MKQRKKIILVGKYHIIEQLGILHLLGVVRNLGWKARVILIKNSDFAPLFKEISLFKPNIVGFSVWTGHHVQTFCACDQVLEMGIPVIIGGPHASYFTKECKKHSTWTVKGAGFRNFRRILQGQLTKGVHFDKERLAEGFPPPDRELMYESYPELAANPIKNILCSLGCPFKCSYCYAPTYNKMYGGFKLNLRPVDEIINEALAIKKQWPASMIFFQDDIFGFNLQWLREFSKKWQKKVKIPWHCQMRFELTKDERRLDLLKEGGCTGITLAIESSSAFLRRFILSRPMPNELIINGVKKIKEKGLTIRTEQILAVPFSNIESDLETLALNVRLNPEMAWTSILAPYMGTKMGDIVSKFGLYAGNNDDLSETFFDRSVLRHVKNGYRDIKPIVTGMLTDKNDNPLLREEGTLTILPTIKYLNAEENKRYCDQVIVLQGLFSWLSKVPKGHLLAKNFLNLPNEKWTWEQLGKLTKKHLYEYGYNKHSQKWANTITNKMGYATIDAAPSIVAQNPWYFCFFPSSQEFAKNVLENNVLESDSLKSFQKLGTLARYWLFDRWLYKIKPSEKPIAHI